MVGGVYTTIADCALSYCFACSACRKHLISLSAACTKYTVANSLARISLGKGSVWLSCAVNSTSGVQMTWRILMLSRNLLPGSCSVKTALEPAAEQWTAVSHERTACGWWLHSIRPCQHSARRARQTAARLLSCSRSIPAGGLPLPCQLPAPCMTCALHYSVKTLRHNGQASKMPRLMVALAW